MEFVDVLFQDQAIEDLQARGIESETVDLVELFDHEPEQVFFGEGGVVEQLGVLENPGVGLSLEGVERLEELVLADVEVADFEQALVDAGVFGVVGVFGAEELVLAFEFAGAGVNAIRAWRRLCALMMRPR